MVRKPIEYDKEIENIAFEQIKAYNLKIAQEDLKQKLLKRKVST